jgi:hypothetical protein
MNDRARLRAIRRYDLGVATQCPYGAGNYTEGVQVLIVGEAHTKGFVPAHEKISSSTQAPFCSMEGCSGWLNELLENAQIDETKLFWCNAVHDGVNTDLEVLIHTLKPYHVVALGNRAHAALEFFGIVHHTFSHPQYHKRFKHKEPYPLIQFLKSVTGD